MTVTRYQRQHEAEWDRASVRSVDAMQDYTLKILYTYLPMITLEREGVVTAIHNTTHLVSVRLDALTAEPALTVEAHFGQPTYPASYVGRRARVWQRIEYRLIQRALVVTHTTFTVDTILGQS